MQTAKLRAESQGRKQKVRMRCSLVMAAGFRGVRRRRTYERIADPRLTACQFIS